MPNMFIRLRERRNSGGGSSPPAPTQQELWAQQRHEAEMRLLQSLANPQFPPQPPPRDIGQETTASLQALINLAPEIFRMESTYGPQYTGLELSNLHDLLNGLSVGGGHTPQPGLLSLYENSILPHMLDTTSAIRGQDISDLSNFGPEAVAALLGADPTRGRYLDMLDERVNSEIGRLNESDGQRDDWLSQIMSTVQGGMPRTEGLLDSFVGPQATAPRTTAPSAISSPLSRELSRQANEELRLGGDLSADQIRDVTQATRAGFSDRGMVRSGDAIMDEIANRHDYRMSRQNQRRAFADQVLGREHEAFGLGTQAANAINMAEIGRANTMNAAEQARVDAYMGLLGATSGFEGTNLNNMLGVHGLLAGRDDESMGLLGQAINMRGSVLGDPMLQVLGRPSGAGSMAGGLLGAGQGMLGAGPSGMFDPMNNYASGLFGGNQNLAGSIYGSQAGLMGSNFGASAGLMGSMYGADQGLAGARANARASLTSNIVGGLLGGGGAAIGGIFCWVAREVYGEDDPRWLKFRVWLHAHAPDWFYRLYARHGQRFARWLHNKPRIKNIVRRWMDTKVEEVAYAI